ncbi:MAG: helix-turn-helix domain-containing protein [Alphaproteobacteria bacterium]|nr:MAG: helix-turn-helix domain-containing protein [Alphaproteobacteria bacterium]
MPAPDLKLLSITRMCLMSMGTKPLPRQTLKNQIRSAIRARLAEGYPALENVADSIRSSPAAIQRELSRDNLNYKDLVEETRRDLALVYVRQRELAFSEIAFLLGYSELSAFSRAFHRWTGTSPRNYRTKETL